MPKDIVQPLDKYVVRFPDGLRDKLKAAAAKNNRSLNAEIVFRLGGSDEFEGEERSDSNFGVADDGSEGLSSKAVQQALKLATDALERTVADHRKTLSQERYMLSQIRLMRALLDQVASTDGNLPHELLAIIRMLSQASTDADSTDERVAALVQEALNAIEQMDEQEALK
ncbi:MAG: Arc family DNA-binding protein [Candidatus Devosia phytovorans]|uniref:Arc family DNA-binding protein n=1 Tax=Candidatus Devosia phytovorans TaxID=3121372 RepID=A0AAJ5VR77_9HYPH|nr:Arc family DNA-binding protein [Devosia sp.]WEK03266.1 MAG: Arc family DNA-binding protein [Devosia sp.]